MNATMFSFVNFGRAVVIVIGSWYYGAALEPMSRLVNIGPIYTQ